MPIKLSVGLSKKLGLPNYGSLGASCHVEFELPQDHAQDDHDLFRRQVQYAFASCRQAVEEELTRHRVNPGAVNGQKNGHSKPESPAGHPAAGAPGSNGNGQVNGATGPAGQNGHAGPNGQRATPKQMEYIRQLTRQISGMGVRRLEALAMRMYHKPLADLSSLEASGLINAMRAIKAGEVELEAALSGATP